jgi:hypothetical protein
MNRCSLHQIAVVGLTVSVGQTHYNNVVLNGNTSHLCGTMMGSVSGYDTLTMYNDSRVAGGINGAINVGISCTDTIG